MKHNLKRVFKVLLIVVNVLAILTIGYFIYAGFYQWKTHYVWLNAPEHSFGIRADFKFLVFFAGLIPVIMYILLKKPVWLLQTAVVIVICLSWKADFMQRTLFRNQPSSIVREMAFAEDFINKYGARFDSLAHRVRIPADSTGSDVFVVSDGPERDTVYKNEPLPDKTIRSVSAPLKRYLGLEPHRPGEYTIEFVSFKNGKVYCFHISPTPALKASPGKPVHSVGMYFYPNGIAPGEPTMKDAYPLNTNLMVVCSDKRYFEGKWIVHIWGLCSG